jgi:hypothetical protein
MSVNAEKSVSDKIKESNTYVGRMLNYWFSIDLLKAKKIIGKLLKYSKKPQHEKMLLTF